MPSSKAAASTKIKKAPVAAPEPMKFVPTWEGAIEGYVVNSMRTNYFRVKRSMTEGDYMQEAMEVFLRISQRYEVVDPPHFMALFKRAWGNRLNDLATNDTRLRAFAPLPSYRGDDGEEIEIESVGELDNEGHLAIMLAQAPKDIQAVISLFLKAPQELVDQALASHRYKAQGNQRVCRLLGLDPSVDVLARVQEYFAAAH